MHSTTKVITSSGNTFISCNHCLPIAGYAPPSPHHPEQSQSLLYLTHHWLSTPTLPSAVDCLMLPHPQHMLCLLIVYQYTIVIHTSGDATMFLTTTALQQLDHAPPSIPLHKCIFDSPPHLFSIPGLPAQLHNVTRLSWCATYIYGKTPVKYRQNPTKTSHGKPQSTPKPCPNALPTATPAKHISWRYSYHFSDWGSAP